MKRVLVTVIVIVSASVIAYARPAAEAVRDIRAYTEAMRETLAEIGVDVDRIDSPDDELLVVYTLQEDGPAPEMALAAVLRLSEPLAGDVGRIRLRNVEGRRTLIEVRVDLQEIDSVLASTVNEAQRAEIDSLLGAALAAAGVNEVRAPRRQSSEEARSSSRIVQEGDVVAGDSESVAQPPPERSPAETIDESPTGEAPDDGDAAAVDPAVAAEALLERLSTEGLENIAIATDATGMWSIEFENRTWRSDIDALARALEVATTVLPPMRVTVQIKRHDVVVSHVVVDLADCARMTAGILSGETLSDKWEVAAGPADLATPVEVIAQGNQSHLRTDLLLRPGVEYAIGLESDPIISDYFLLTNLQTTIAPGLWANLRFPAQLTSRQQVTMDRGLLTWVGRPSRDFLATGSVGKFDDLAHGYYGELRTDSDAHQFGLVGTLVSSESGFDPTDRAAGATAYYQYDWGDAGLNTRLSYGQFTESGERGATLSLRRRYGESVIEARANRTDDGRESLAFEISLPLGPRRAAEPEQLRLRSDRAFRFDYVSSVAVRGDYLQGPQDLESFRGELSPAYLQRQGARLAEREDRPSDTTWPVAPSYEGTSGLIRIPTADVAADGELFAGVSYLNREHSKVAGDDTDAMPTFLGFGFLPNLELVGRLTFFYDAKAYDWDYNLDRSFNVHYRLNRQRGEWFPAIAVGAQDVMFGTHVSYLGEGEYAVATWEHDRLRGHLGVGSGRYEPVFGGLEWSIGGENAAHAIAEYDSDYVNAGMRWFMEDWGTASISLLGMRNVTGSLTFRTHLR